MTAIEAAFEILQRAGKALHYAEITKQAIDGGLWSSDGATPDATLNAELSTDIKEQGEASRFARVGKGVYSLRDLPALSSPPKSVAAETTKFTVAEIQRAAMDLIAAHPSGIRYGRLIEEVQTLAPATPRNTIHGSVWDLHERYKDRISKPSRGLFVPVVGPVTTTQEVVRKVPRLDESAFYAALADYLKHELEVVTDAIPLGGALFKAKWGTPDVLGSKRPQRTDTIQFPIEIVAAELKVDTSSEASITGFGQAAAYRLFASRSYVAVPKSVRQDDLDRLQSLCELFGIGLLRFDATNAAPSASDFDQVHPAQLFTPDAYYSNQLARQLYDHDRELGRKVFGG